MPGTHGEDFPLYMNRFHREGENAVASVKAMVKAAATDEQRGAIHGAIAGLVASLRAASGSAGSGGGGAGGGKPVEINNLREAVVAHLREQGAALRERGMATSINEFITANINDPGVIQEVAKASLRQGAPDPLAAGGAGAGGGDDPAEVLVYAKHGADRLNLARRLASDYAALRESGAGRSMQSSLREYLQSNMAAADRRAI